MCDLSCGVQDKITIILILLTFFGMFIGSFTYYFISERYEKKMFNMQKNVDHAAKLLDGGQKNVFKVILQKKGVTTQSEIVKKTGFTRVQVSRHLTQLESKQIIKKSKEGILLTTHVYAPFRLGEFNFHGFLSTGNCQWICGYYRSRWRL